MRSLRDAPRSTSPRSATLGAAVALLQAARFGLVIVETAGIGQSDSEIVDLVDLPLYVMTPEYGAASQLEKIDMLDLASLVVLNKFDRRGGEDALRDVRKQWRRNRVAFTLSRRRGAGVPDDREPLRRPGHRRACDARSSRMLALAQPERRTLAACRERRRGRRPARGR